MGHSTRTLKRSVTAPLRPSAGYQQPTQAARRPATPRVVAIEADVVRGVENIFKALVAHDFAGPVSVLVSLLGVRNSQIESGIAGAVGTRLRAIDRDPRFSSPTSSWSKVPADPRKLLPLSRLRRAVARPEATSEAADTTSRANGTRAVTDRCAQH